MNKKGFTLIEILIVIVLIAVVALIAVPNVVEMLENGKKAQVVSDAKSLVTATKYKQNLDSYAIYFPNSNGECKEISASNLGVDLSKDPDDNDYDLTNSKVKVCLNNNAYNYQVLLKSSKWGTSNNNTFEYITEANINTEHIIKK